MSGIKIPFNNCARQFKALRQELLADIAHVLESGRYLNGEETSELELTIAEMTGRHYAVATNSCSTALRIVMEYCELNKLLAEDPSSMFIAAPNFSYIATANALTHHRSYQTMYYDVNHNGLLDFAKVDYRTTKIIMAVDMWGLMPEYDKAATAAMLSTGGVKNDVIIIEDAAQSFGSKFNGKPAGSFGLASCLSFDPTKVLSCSSGGMILTDDHDLYRFAREATNNGNLMSKYSDTVTGKGFMSNTPSTVPTRQGNRYHGNLKITEVDACTLLTKLPHVPTWQARRKQIADYYFSKLIKGFYGGIEPLSVVENCEWNYFRFPITLPREQDRDLMMYELDKHGIECKIHYDYALCKSPLTSNAGKFIIRGLSLPIYAELTDLEVEYIVEKVTKVLT